MDHTTRIAILGAGPVGIEAALYARTLGYPTVVYEAGRIGEHLLRWGHVTLFTPWSLNVSPLGERRLLETGMKEFPGNVLPTGGEVVREYLIPLSRLPEMENVIQEGRRVHSVGRGDLLKGDGVGDGSRDGVPFRILVDGDGGETVEEADAVLDTTGVYGQSNSLGQGGIPAPGERAAAAHVVTGVPDVSGKDRSLFQGKRVLVVGGGASAATTVIALAALDSGEVVWATRSGTPPIPEIEDDPLPSRLSLTRTANELAGAPSDRFRHLPHSSVVSLQTQGTGVRVTLQGPEGEATVDADVVVNQTGFRPDNRLYRELQIHECFASQGPMKLAASLLGDTSGDCMAHTGFGPESLINPEPGFFLIGHKSYGRNPNFLLRIGREQVRDVFRLLTGDTSLDLYNSETTRV